MNQVISQNHPQLTIVNFNLNGIRAAAKRGFSEWLKQVNPDVLLAQEVRASPAIAASFFPAGWEVHVHECEIKGRAGVLVATRPGARGAGSGTVSSVDGNSGIAVNVDNASSSSSGKTVSDSSDSSGSGGSSDSSSRSSGIVCEINSVQPGLGVEVENPEDTGRWLEAVLDTVAGKVRVISAYFHSGELDTPKQEAKMRHLGLLDRRLNELLTDPIPTVVGGDYNVVRSALDIKNWKPNHNKRAGVLDEEIAYLDQWVQAGWQDVTRDLAGEVQGPYTWWSWRGKAFDNNAGWRIDYQFAANAGVPAGNRLQAIDFQVGRAAAYDERISDHAPLSVTYTWG